MGEEIGFVTSRMSTIRTDIVCSFQQDDGNCRQITKSLPRRCEPTGRRKAPPDDRLREAIQRIGSQHRIASSQVLLAMTEDRVRMALCRENTAPPGRGP